MRPEDYDDPQLVQRPPEDRRPLDVYTTGAALYVTLLKNGYLDEATEFAEWFLDTFDLDLET